MTARSSLAVVLSLLLSALPAAAQVRTVPADVGAAPISAHAVFSPSSFSPVESRSPSDLTLVPALNAPAPQPNVVVGATPTTAKARPEALGPVAVPLAASRAAAPAPNDAAEEPAGTERSEPAIPNGDQMFDGRGKAVAPQVAPAPEVRPGVAGPALKAKTRVRAWHIAAVTVPAVAAAAVFGAATPQLALVALHWLGQGAYWLANPFAFAFTLPQIHRMLSHRSADVSTAMMAVGLLSTLLMSLNFAFDGKDLMMYRNLAQAGGFAAMFGLKSLFGRAHSDVLPSRRRVTLETAAIALASVGVLALIGPALAAALPAIPMMSALLVPLQVLSGFGFTYLMYAQLSKMRREHSAGDSSPAMMWAYLGTKTIWVWSLATMLALSTAPAWLTLSAGALFTAVCWFAGKAALSRLLRAPWAFLPETLTLRGHTITHDAMAEIGAFLLLSSLILALSAVGYIAFTALLGIPAAAAPRFAMYLLYMVQSLVACLATLKTLQIRARFEKK